MAVTVAVPATDNLHQNFNTAYKGSPSKGSKLEVATSPLRSRRARRRLNCHITPAFSAVPIKGHKIISDYTASTFSRGREWGVVLHNTFVLGIPHGRGPNQKWLHHPCLLWGSQEGGIAPYPLRSRGSPPNGTKLEVATSLQPSWGPARGRNCYMTHVFSAVPIKGDKIRSGYITFAFSGDHKRAQVLHNSCILCSPRQRPQHQKWLHHPCVLGDSHQPRQNWKWLHHSNLLGGPQKGGIATYLLRSRGSQSKGTKSELATSPLPSRGATRGRKCYIILALSATPVNSHKIRRGYITLVFSWPTRGRTRSMTPAFSGIPTKRDKIGSGYITPTFLGAHKRAELLHNPCVLGDSHRPGQNWKWLHHSNLLGGPQEGGIAT